MKQYLSEREVSAITGFRLPTLRNHRHLHKGIPYIKAERSVRYDPEDVETYMQERRVAFPAADR